MAHWIPTDDDYKEVRRRFLTGLTEGHDANQIIRDLADLHRPRNTFPGEALMWLGADALDLAGYSRSEPLQQEDLLTAFLPERRYRGRDQQRINFAILSSAGLHGGLEPELLDEVAYWIEDYWVYAVAAAVVLTRAGARRTGISVGEFARRLALAHGLGPDPDTSD